MDPAFLAVAVGVGVFAAIGIIAYTIYAMERDHRGRGGGSGGGGSGGGNGKGGNFPLDYDDIKPDDPKRLGGKPGDPKRPGGKPGDPICPGGKPGDPKRPGGRPDDPKRPGGRPDDHNQPGLRRRVVPSKSTKTQVFPLTKDSGTQAEPWTPPGLNESLKSVDTQTYITSPDLLNDTMSHGNNDNDTISDLTSDSETVISITDSVDTVTGGDWNTSKIPMWDEMGDHEKSMCICRACERPVQTLTNPCKHPYMCDKCVIHFYPHYNRCPLCQNRIDGYGKIYP